MTPLLVLIALFAGAWASPPSARIIDGQDAAPGQFPYILSLQTPTAPGVWVHGCGAAILTDRWAVTAAHCIYANDTAYRVVAGITKLNGTNPQRQVILVGQTVIHPKFGGLATVGPYDIGLIKLVRSLKFGLFVRPISLPSLELLPPIRILSGWGAVQVIPDNDPDAPFPYEYILPNKLQWAKVQLISYEECNAAYADSSGTSPVDPKLNICGSTADGVSFCAYDSGSPLEQNGVLIGLVSWGPITCASTPNVYTKVAPYVYSFILKYIGI